MALLLTSADVKGLLNISDTMEAVEEGFRQLALGTVKMPLRTAINVPENGGLNLVMPVYIGGETEALGTKVISVFPDNPRKYGMPSVIATVLVNNPRTGELLAIMDGSFLTAMRTGAAGGVATKYLARNDAKVVGIFGAGIQARTQLMAISEVRDIELVKVFDLVARQGEQYSQEMSQRLGLEVRPVEHPRLVVEGSDIVVTATSSPVPVFEGEWLEEGAHVNGIGSHSPDTRELDQTTIIRASVFVDSLEAALAEAGDLIVPINEGAITKEHLKGELGEVISGLKVGRGGDEEITLFKSVGLALQDVLTAQRVYKLARQGGIGQAVSLYAKDKAI